MAIQYWTSKVYLAVPTFSLHHPSTQPSDTKVLLALNWINFGIWDKVGAVEVLLPQIGFCIQANYLNGPHASRALFFHIFDDRLNQVNGNFAYPDPRS